MPESSLHNYIGLFYRYINLFFILALNKLNNYVMHNQSHPGLHLTLVRMLNVASLPIQLLFLSVDSLNLIVIFTIFWIFYLNQDPKIWKIHDKMLTPKLPTWGKRHGTFRQRQQKRISMRHKAIALLAMPLIVHSSEIGTKRQRRFRVDTDSSQIGVDNRCTACISNKVEDFLNDLTHSKRVIKGFGGSQTTNLMVGTLKWSWADDEGIIHDFLIPHSYYVPHGNCKLLSPQHWAKHQRKLHPRYNTGEFTNYKET